MSHFIDNLRKGSHLIHRGASQRSPKSIAEFKGPNF